MKVDGEEIKTTDEHPFWVVGKGWTGASHLKSGDILKLENGKKVKVDEVWIEKLITPVKVYNFEVADWHTYYVSDAGVLVHNKCVKVASKSVKVDKSYFKNFDGHFEKHVINQKEFGNISRDEYFTRALDLATRKVDGKKIISKSLSNGREAIYNKSTNEIVITHGGQKIGTFFKPSNGIKYFNGLK